MTISKDLDLTSEAEVKKCPVNHSFNPFDQDYLDNPYPHYPPVRTVGPVFYAPAIDMYVVTRYADMNAVFLDPATFSAAIAQAPLLPLSPEAQQILEEGDFRPPRTMSNLDPPEHARIRALNAKTFSARRLAVLEPRVQQTVEELIEAFINNKQAELVSQLTFPLPTTTIFALIGFPPEDTPMLKSWCDRRLSFTWGHPTPEEQVAITQSMVAYWHYCQEFVERRITERTDDFTSGLLNMHEADPTSISQIEVASVIYGFSIAGHETTTNMLANTLRQLLTHREAWEALCQDATLIHNAVEEALRFDTSVITWRRVTTRASEIGGVHVPAGAKILLLLGAAGHDPDYFPDPDAFDIRRSNAKNHIAFGKGIHYCIGAPLARMEISIVLELLTQKIPGLRLVPNQRLEFPPNISFRGPEKLLVEW